jgi:hypothetical protein
MHLPARAHYIALPAWRRDQQTSAPDLAQAFGHRVDRFLINIKFQVKFCFFNGARGWAGPTTNIATTGNAPRWPQFFMHFKILYIVPFLTLSITSYSQIRFQNLALTNPDTNYLYIGVDNKIQLTGLKRNSSTRVEMYDMFYSADKDGLFHVKAVSRGTGDIHIYQNSKIVASKTYHIDRIPEPMTSFGALRDTSVSKSEILNYDQLRATMPNCFWKNKFTVVRFNIQIVSKLKELNSTNQIIGSRLPAAYKSIIAKLQSGDKLLFENVTIGGPDDGPLDSFYVMVK